MVNFMINSISTLIMGVSRVMGESPIAGWFTMETPISMDDLGYPQT
jgi:hypothetical protein